MYLQAQDGESEVGGGRGSQVDMGSWGGVLQCCVQLAAGAFQPGADQITFRKSSPKEVRANF